MVYTISNIIVIDEPGVVIAAISIGLMIMSSMVRRATIDRVKMEEIRDRMKELQKTMKSASKSGNTKKLQTAQQEMMKLTMENMKQSFRPMVITIIPFIVIFGWLKNHYDNAGTVATVLGFDFSWFWWYLVCAMITSLIINKVLKLM
ncbi:MAG TPA: DUF106 domain-containing protein [Candidatus Altiarchaeales archaeon]|nr:DUF106 domain-containing protein [Candidatus Altiarchaeales archaeon]